MKTYEEVWLPEIDAGRKYRVGTVIGDKICYMGRVEGWHIFDRYTYECIESPPFDPSKNKRFSVAIGDKIYRL